MESSSKAWVLSNYFSFRFLKLQLGANRAELLVNDVRHLHLSKRLVQNAETRAAGYCNFLNQQFLLGRSTQKSFEELRGGRKDFGTFSRCQKRKPLDLLVSLRPRFSFSSFFKGNFLPGLLGVFCTLVVSKLFCRISSTLECSDLLK
jgi:hypothetical protein